jgi:hypothetical protein
LGVLMGLEKYHLGDEAFTKFSKAFADDWEEFSHKDALLKLVGDIELARPIAWHAHGMRVRIFLNGCTARYRHSTT